MVNNFIEVEKLIRVYKQKDKELKAIDDVSFSIRKGEVFGLLGPNGAGKSTIIKILTTLLSPTSGSAKVLGFDTFKKEEKIRPRINFVYGGERSLYWRLTARENLNYFADLYKVKNNKDREDYLNYLLDLVGLKGRENEKVETYSKGMKQRLQIARGLVNKPEVLFLDEPTIGLDPISALELRKIIKNLANKGTTIFFTTHYMEEADDVCDRIAIINKGKIRIMDTPDNLKKTISKKSEIVISYDSDFDVSLFNTMFADIEVENKSDDKIVSIKCDKPYSLVGKIIEAIGEEKINSLNVKNTSLEDVYVHYVGGQAK